MCLGIRMPLSRVRVRNFRSIEDSGELELGPITILTGRNNSGKSALLRAIFLLQGDWDSQDRRLRSASVPIISAFFTPPFPPHITQYVDQITDKTTALLYSPQSPNTYLFRGFDGLPESTDSGPNQHIPRFPQVRTDASYMAPIFSRRKSSNYETAVGSASAFMVSTYDNNLTSRLTALTGDHEDAARYRDLVTRVLDMRIGTFLVGQQGQQPGVPISSVEGIQLDRMGEGISSALALIVGLADTRNALFLIEEPENDLHPEALRALLDVLVESVPTNQLIVSTHSDFVLRHLGAVEGTVVYKAAPAENAPTIIPTTIYSVVRTQAEKLELLSELGYEPELPAAWLVFEESTAERVCRQVLIPTFAPRLAAARTISASGASKVPRLVNDLHNVVLFAQLSARYDRKTWVLVDGDDAGLNATAKLREEFDWPPSHFRNLPAGHFEEYYPPRFSAEVTAALAIAGDWQARAQAKGELAERVCEWATNYPDLAAQEFAESAADVIRALAEIEAELFPARPRTE
jgi:predicted ATPase